jgi:uncharacterized protein (DUF1778 family)
MLHTNDKRHRITLRLNDEQFSFVRTTAEVLGVSPSEFLRMVVNASMVGMRKDEKVKEVIGRENDKTYSDN